MRLIGLVNFARSGAPMRGIEIFNSRPPRARATMPAFRHGPAKNSTIMRGDEFFSGIATQAPFTRLHPRIGAFLKDYFAKEKVISFGGRFVVNTNFPPYPSAAFDQLVEQFAHLGNSVHRRLYSVTLAVTNRCPFNCWHCYNAGRSQTDMPLGVVRNLAGELQQLGAVMVTLTGGEPLLRADLPEIARAFDARSCLIVGTTGDTLDAETAQRLRDSGVFAVGISLDADNEHEHDWRRGRKGAFRNALRALQVARDNGLYPYAVTVATRDLLPRERFIPFLRFAANAGALEVHVLEPSPAGKLAGQTSILLHAAERQQLFAYQAEVADDETLPILSSYAYLESPEAFGCGAGLTHLYIDGGGEVCPCNLVPMSFGNLTREPFGDILNRMGKHFCAPRPGCVGRQLARHFPRGGPTEPAQSEALCERFLPRAHALPEFFRVREQAEREAIGAAEVRAAYDYIHADYDAFWLVEAGRSIDALVARLPWSGRERVFEAGCGTGYATVQLARRAATVTAVDLSTGMLRRAEERLHQAGAANVHFALGDALAQLDAHDPCDLVFTTWVLGYIPLLPFFANAHRVLKSGGRVAFLVHRENSPREPLEVFTEIVAQNPAALRKGIAFDFPRDAVQVRSLLESAGFEIEWLEEDAIDFRYLSAAEVLQHLLKSGAGTAYYDAVDPDRRAVLMAEFLWRLTERRPPGAEGFTVRHDYIGCIARKP
jgi:MoaA/NifB/PqqE/SkfB family radical SAM enzyme/SAM-dependent methyltransferase